MSNFKDELQSLIKKHGIESAMFVMCHNQDKGASKGQLMVSVETIFPDENDMPSRIFLMGCKMEVETLIPRFFDNVQEVKRND